MNYPTAIVIAAALVAGAIFADTSVGAAPDVGRYQIDVAFSEHLYRVDTVSGQIDLITCDEKRKVFRCITHPDVAKVLPE